jgi:two-component system OmpR family response regulator
VSRARLGEAVWEVERDSLANLVDVHVSRLRRKLDEAGGAPLLHTIRGAGFILDERPR